MRVIAFTGLPGSGKSAAIDVARKHGVPVVRMGDFVLEEVRDQGLQETEEDIGPVATGMRETHGDDIWARRTLEAIQGGRAPGVHPDTRLVVVDGVRSPAEVERFRRALGDDFTLVAIEASEPVRHERLLGRGRTDDPQDADLVRARDEREKGWGLEEAIASARERIVNEGTLQELHAQVAALLQRTARTRTGGSTL